MTEKDIMELLNGTDNDLIDKKIDELLKEKGENIGMNNIKEKAMDKVYGNKSKKKIISAKLYVAAALAASIMLVTVYAEDISNVLQSFFNKSTVYSTIVDGDAYYLETERKLNQKVILSDLSVSEGRLEATIKFSEKTEDEGVEKFGISIIPSNDKNVRYTVGGYGIFGENEYSLLFWNETYENYDIKPFKDFTFEILGEAYDISLEKAESVKVDEDLAIGESEVGSESGTKIANIAATITANDAAANIQLIPSFQDPDLQLSAFGETTEKGFDNTFENHENGSISGSGGLKTEPVFAYDKNNKAYQLEIPKDSARHPVTIFEVNADANEPLTVKIPTVSAYYRKDITSFGIQIPEEGKVVLDKEVDFLIQKAVLKSITRATENSAVLEFELNTGDNKEVFISNLGAYSRDVTSGETLINGDRATMTVIFDQDLAEANFSFSWPYFVIEGNWEVKLNQ